jgi:hypothetical protein
MNKCDFQLDKVQQRKVRIAKIQVDLSKAQTLDDFDKANKDFDALYNSSQQCKQLIDSWNTMGR